MCDVCEMFVKEYYGNNRLILEVSGQRSRSQWTRMEKAVNPIHTKPLCASLSNLADMKTMVNPIDFGGHSSKVKVTMGIIDKCGVRGDATLCVVIFYPLNPLA